MPKKSTKHVKTSGTIKRLHIGDSARSVEAIVEHPSLHIGLENTERWIALKKRMGFASDDDLAVHLLDLAETNVRKNEKHNAGEKQQEGRDGDDSLEVIADDRESSRRSPRKHLLGHLNVVEASVSNKAECKESTQSEVDIGDQQNGRHKTKVKHHRSKAKHHKDKRKKKRHGKNDEPENNIDNSATPVDTATNSADNKHEDFDPVVDSTKLDEELCNVRGTRDESVIQKTEKIDTIVLANNLDSKENISENPQSNTDNLIDDDLSVQGHSDFTKNLSSQCSVVKQIISNTVFEVFNRDDIHDRQQASESHQDEPNCVVDCSHNKEIIHTNESKLLSDIKTKDDSEEKKTKKKRKHLKYEVDPPDKNETSEVHTLEESGYKHRKKKHKHTVEHKNKKNHDVRKAPQDGMIPMDVCESQPEANELISSTSNVSQADLEPDGGILEPQRLAIKIKLCQDCNNRHIQGACPLMSTVYKISDILRYEEWLNRHKNNPEVIKAIATEDPMSEGYGKVVDDGFESDEDSPDQYKSKARVQSEEKRLLVDKERPLYARESLPDCLELKMTNLDHGLGIFAKNAVPMYSKLGPLVGNTVKEMDIPDDFPMRHIWEIDNDGKTSYISTTNPLKSNWVRYMRPAETKEDRSVAVITRHGELYFVTTQNIAPGTELTYWADSQSFAWARKNKTDKTNCGGCNLTFAHSIYYRLHCCIFHDTNYSLTIRKYHCKVCGAAVLGKENIMKHAAELHAGRGAYQCQYCRKFFLRLNYLEMHRTYGCAQNPQRSRPLCDFCGRKFCQPQKLKVHIKRMHSDMSEVLREFQCKLCMKLLGSRAALQRHMKEVHHKDVVAAATCDRCGKMFQNKSNLKIHMLTHSGVKPFKCKENNCKAAFTTKQCLQFHYKKVHGLTEEMMPKIERSVAYTFDAYSGGLLEEMGTEKSPRSSRHDSQEQGNSLASIDDCSSEGSLKNDTSSNSVHLTQVEFQADVNTVERPLNRESPRDQPLRQDMGHVNVTLEPSLLSIRQDQDPCAPSRLQSKGSKKWMGEFNPPSTKIPEHSHSVTPTDVYEFEDTIKKDEGRSSPLPTASLMDDSKLALSVYRRTESANASLLVEAALDAAERDIGAVSSPMLEDNDRDGNLYSISNHLQSPLPSRSPEHHLESYIQQQDDLMSPVPTPDNRNSSPTHIHADYHLHRSIDYVNVTRTHNIEQYLHHEELQRNSPPSNYIHMSQGDLGSLSTTPNPRYSEVHHHHQVSAENLSSDEGDSVAQNLSISVKEKALQLDLSTSYKYDSLDLEFGNRERTNFEPLVLNNGELQGLDMSARGFHSFGSQIQNSRYHHHHHLYEITERQSVDLSRTGAYSISPPPPYPSHSDVLRVVSLDLTPGGRHSVDLSLSRSHHLHGTSSRMITSPRPPSSTTPHTVPEIVEGRMLPSPPPPLPGYNPAYPVSPASYHPPRPGYHHYSGYY